MDFRGTGRMLGNQAVTQRGSPTTALWQYQRAQLLELAHQDETGFDLQPAKYQKNRVKRQTRKTNDKTSIL